MNRTIRTPKKRPNPTHPTPKKAGLSGKPRQKPRRAAEYSGENTGQNIGGNSVENSVGNAVTAGAATIRESITTGKTPEKTPVLSAYKKAVGPVEWRCSTCRARGIAHVPALIVESHAMKQPTCNGTPIEIGV